MQRFRFEALAAALTIAAASVATAQGGPPSQPPGPGYHIVTLPSSAGAGERKEVKTLLETAHLKLASITLRGGTLLEEHSAPMPVTIQVLSGRGTVEMGDIREAIDPAHMISLAPGVKHSVRPDGESDLVLLVHHFKMPAGRGRP